MDIYAAFGLDPNDPYVQASGRMAHDRFRIASLLKKVREENGISQAEAARRMGTDQAAISRIESGERDLRMSTLRRYADAIHAEITMHVINVERGVRGSLPAGNKWETNASQYELQVQGV